MDQSNQLAFHGNTGESQIQENNPDGAWGGSSENELIDPNLTFSGVNTVVVPVNPTENIHDGNSQQGTSDSKSDPIQPSLPVSESAVSATNNGVNTAGLPQNMGQ